MSFSFSFSLFSLFPLLFLIAVIVIVMNGRKTEDKLNDAAPVQTLTVRVAAKRVALPQGHTVPDYYMTFEAPDGSRLELQVDEQTYRAFREGEIGDLVYQRKRFLGFNPQELPYDAQYPQDYNSQTPLY